MTSRLDIKGFDELTPAQQTQYERIAKSRSPGANEQFGGPFDPWIRSPEVLFEFATLILDSTVVA